MSVGIVAQDPLAADVGSAILARGGNAIDAVIASAFAQCVVSPFMTSLGGSARLHYFEARTRRTTLLDAAAEVGSFPTPSSWDDEESRRIETIGQYELASKANLVGSWAVMVPGLVKGCWVAFERLSSGRFSWRELLLPAVELAERGFAIDSALANAWEESASSEFSSMTTTERLKRSEAARRVYLKVDGSGYQEHERLLNRELARTLLRLADAGGDDFYHGEIARKIAADLAVRGSTVTLEDLERYEAREVAPLVGYFHGLQILTAPAPSQGPIVAEMLQIAERAVAPGMAHNSTRYVDLLADIQRAAFSDAVRAAEGREEAPGDNLSPARADFWAAKLRSGGHITVDDPVPTEQGTTHASAIDREGNVALLTHSIGSSGGSGVATGDLGFLYNNFLGHFRPHRGSPDSILAGKRMGGGAPTFLCEDGQPRLAIGAAGGSRLVTAMVQTIINAVLFGFRPRDAVSLPRVHSEQGRIVFLEEAFSDSLVQGLRERGNDVRRSRHLARVQLIGMDEGGSVEVAADPRGGAALMLTR